MPVRAINGDWHPACVMCVHLPGTMNSQPVPVARVVRKPHKLLITEISSAMRCSIFVARREHNQRTSGDMMLYVREETEMPVSPDQFFFRGVPLIGFDAVKALWETNQNVRLVCVLTEDTFLGNIIKNTEWIPMNRMELFEERIPDKTEVIITYCGGYKCPQSHLAAQKLIAMDYTHVLAYKGGMREWLHHKMPLGRVETAKP